MRVAYVSTCGAGHLNTLRSLCYRHGSQEDTRLFLVRFADEPTPSDREAVAGDAVIITCNQPKPSETAAVFNEVRSRALQDALHVWLHDYAPTLIVYDFFCLEARAVSRRLAVPAICSIPATLKPDETETCSDAVLPKEHFYWVWREPYKVAVMPVAFLGPRLGNGARDVSCSDTAIVTVVTFGTVIPKYRGCQERLAQIMAQVEELARQKPNVHFVFAGIQGPSLPNCTSYSDCNLPGLLSRACVALLIFHGGGNTYAEALSARVPGMLVCPFFGDQFETARQEGNEYSGDLLADVKRVKPHHYPKDAMRVLQQPFKDCFPDYFRVGDLVFGHRRHRAALQRAFPQVDLHLEHYKPFAEFARPDRGELPAIADVYNDEFWPANCEAVGCSPYNQRLFEVALRRASAAPSLTHLNPEHRLVHHCLDILHLTVSKWGGRIHFVLGPAEEIGVATQIELDEIERKWDELCEHVLFYNLNGRRVPAPWSCRPKAGNREAGNRFAVAGVAGPVPLAPYNYSVARALAELPGRMPFVVGRQKEASSIVEKETVRKLPLLDKWGYRTGYLDRADLERLQQRVLTPSPWKVSVNWCRQKVWYYYYGDNDEGGPATEIQIWPWVFLHCFYLNQAGVETDRQGQFAMQEALERIYL